MHTLREMANVLSTKPQEMFALLGLSLSLSLGMKGANGKQTGTSSAHQQRFLLILKFPADQRVKVLLHTWTGMGIVSEERARMLMLIARKHFTQDELKTWCVQMCKRHQHFEHVFK